MRMTGDSSSTCCGGGGYAASYMAYTYKGGIAQHLGPYAAVSVDMCPIHPILCMQGKHQDASKSLDHVHSSLTLIAIACLS